MTAIYSAVIGVGSYIPGQILTNYDLERILKERWPDGPDDKWTDNKWILERTGIVERHIATAQETNASMGAMAARRALHNAGIAIKDIDFIVCATNTNRVNFPSCAMIIQDILGGNKTRGNHKDIPGYDIQAGCTAFNYALAAADDGIRAGRYARGLVIGVDKLTDITDYSDRNTCVLFGDLASAWVIEKAKKPGIIKHHLGGDGSGKAQLVMTDKRHIWMNGREVFKFASRAIADCCKEIIKDTGYKLKDVKIIPHQANKRITEAAEKMLGAQAYSNIDRFGNTSAASYPYAFEEALGNGWLREDDLVILVGFGAGLTYGANLIKVGKLKT
ncbi:MAG: beta-ketoacyl-ACP synthase 3 [Planctomycetes bacterium]|nr:beta-ketoacyl-ACP synthase 3 [Planctomycetota bacterium]